MADIRIVPAQGAINVTGSADFRGAGGASVLFVTGSGQIGAGTTSPDSEFHVVGSGTRFLTLDRSGVRSYDLGVNSSGTFLVTDNSAAVDRIALSHSGSVGIGTTQPTQLLHLVNAAGPVIRLVRSSNRFDIEADTNSAGIVSRDSATANFSITGFGNVGIGSASPAVPLDVVGKIRSVNANDQLTIKRSDNTGTRIGHDALGLYFANDDTSLDVLRIYGGTAGAERFVIGSTGGIKLSSYGSGAKTGTAAYNLSVDSSGNIIETANPSLGGSGTANYVTKWSNSSTLTDSIIYDDGTNIGVGESSPSYKLHVGGTFRASGLGSFGGNVGIGTTNPSQKLQIGASTDTVSYARIVGSTSDFYLGQNSTSAHLGVTNGAKILQTASYPLVIGTTANQEVYLGANNATIMTLVTGNVGIGSSIPEGKLNVVGSADVLIVEGSGSTANTTLMAVDGNNGRLFEVSDDLSDSLFSVNTIAGLPVMEAFADNTVTLGAYNQYDLHITGSRVGIGTSAPIYKLDVSGSARLTVGGTGATYLYFHDTTTNKYLAYFVDDAYWRSPGKHYFEATSGFKGAWDANGNLGIGTTSPGKAFVVTGARNDEWIATFTNTGTNPYGVYIDTSANASTVFSFATYTNTGTGFFVLNNGNVGVGTSSPGARLDVSGSIYVRNGNELRLYNPAGNDWGVLNFTATNDLNLNSTVTVKNSGGVNSFYPNTTEVTDLGRSSFQFRDGYLSRNLTVGGDLTVTGIITAKEFHTTFVSASIIYQSGSTQFGNSSDDTHIFTGNIGIGNTNPTTRLTIGTNSSVQSTTGIALGYDQASLEFVHSTYSSGFGSKFYMVDQGSGITTLRLAVRADSTAWTDALTVIAGTSGNGNIGIGTTNPGYKLDVVGDARISSNLSINGYSVTDGIIYHASNINVLNKASNGWLTWATRNTSGAEVVVDLNYLGSVTATSFTGSLLGNVIGNVTGNVTGTAGSETLATVTGRGATTAVPITMSYPGTALALSGTGSNISFKDVDNVWTGYVGFDGNTGQLSFPGRNVLITAGYNGTIELSDGASGYNAGKVYVPYGNLIVENGNIGVNTTSPSNRIQVVGGVTATSFTGSLIGNVYTNSIYKQTTGSPIVINAGSDASRALRVYYDMDVYNGINWTDASWNVQGSIAASSGLMYYSANTGHIFDGDYITFTGDSAFYVSGSGGGYPTFYADNGSAQIGFGRQVSSTGLSYLGSDATYLFRLWDASFNQGYFNVVRSNGNVGIGVTTPGYKLHVDGTGYFTGALTANSNFTVNGRYFINGSTTFGYKIAYNGVTLANGTVVSDSNAADGYAVYMDSTLSSTMFYGPYTSISNGEYVASFRMKVSDNSSTSALGQIDIIGTNTLGSTMFITPSMFETSNRYQYIDIPFTANGSNANIEFRGVSFNAGITNTYLDHIIIRPLSKNYIQLQPENKNYDIFYHNVGTPRFRIKADGNVGIGTSAPGEKLDVNGSIRLSESGRLEGRAYPYTTTVGSGADATTTYVEAGSTNTYRSRIALAGGSATDPNTIKLETASTERMRITAAGNVGIGTTGPSEILHVKNPGNSGASWYSVFLGQNSTGYQNALNVRVKDEITDLGADVLGTNYGSNLTLSTRPNGGSLTEYMRITSIGSVGIGTTGPSHKLEVRGDVRLRVDATGLGPSIILNNGTEVAGNYSQIAFGGTQYATTYLKGAIAYVTRTETNGRGDFYFLQETTNNGNNAGLGNAVMVVTNLGNVGIGTTSPDQLLMVANSSTNAEKGIIIRNSHANTSADASLRVDGYAGSYIDFYRNQSFRWRFNRIAFSDDLKITADTGAGGAGDVMYFDYDTGNVGIGSTAPEAKLNVVGSADVLIVEGSGSTANTTIMAVDGNNGRLFEVSDDLSDSLFSVNTIAGLPVMEAFADNTVVLGAYNQCDLVVTGSRVGIGTCSPTVKLHVADSDGGRLILQGVGGSGINWQLNSYTDGKLYLGNYGVADYIAITSTGNLGIGSMSPAYKLDVSGTIRATGDVIAYSDARVKENVVTLENSLEKVQNLRGVSYNKIGETEKKIGVIAQEVLEVLPEVVSQDSEGTYSVAYGNITAVLIEAIKEQQKQIDELKEEIKKLKG